MKNDGAITAITLLIFGIGNDARGDDALGPLILREVEKVWQEIVLKLPHTALQIRFSEAYQLMVEDALELENIHYALFIDACYADDTKKINPHPPFTVRAISPNATPSVSTHQLSPAELLSIYEKSCRKPAPPSWVLGLTGVDFALGTPLSPAAVAHKAEALAWLLGKIESFAQGLPLNFNSH